MDNVWLLLLEGKIFPEQVPARNEQKRKLILKLELGLMIRLNKRSLLIS